MRQFGAERMSFGGEQIEKLTPQGRLQLFLNEKHGSMSFLEHDLFVLQNEFALQEPKNSHSRIWTRFSDFRSGKARVTSLYGLDSAPTLAGFRQMIRGTRWMSANMLNWENSTIILPEYLDTRSKGELDS